MTANYFELRKRLSTRRDFNIWRESPEGLRAKCEGEHYSLAACRGELAKLQALAQTENQAAWDVALSMAKVKVYDDYEAQPDVLRDREKREALERAEAEKLCIEYGFAPPHWQTSKECIDCGWVLVKATSAPCPWCDTDAGRAFREARTC